MELSRRSCRLCLSETEFNVSLFGNYSKKTDILNKILVCLSLCIEETDTLNTVCYKCAENVERFYEFTMQIKKSQTRLCHEFSEPRAKADSSQRLVSSFVKEVVDADYTFSFLEILEDKKEKASSPFFSYFSAPSKRNDKIYKRDDKLQYSKERYGPKVNSDRPKHSSRDMFESQSQDAEDPRRFDWKLTPDDNIMRRVREKCFGRSDF